jgi:arginyl-tRNA synthetase
MKQLQTAINETCQRLFNVPVSVELTRPDEQFGDYATNVALQLSKQVGQNPRAIAEAIVAELKDDLIAEATVAGPGFINLRLTDQALIELAHTKPAQSLAGQTVVAEYSDPNPFKVLHAGHLYTTLVGDAIARLLDQAGANVHRVNFGGDVGLHVGRCMWAIVKFLGGERPDELEKVPPESRLEWLSERYVEGNIAYEEDESSRMEIIEVNKRVYKLHAEDDHESDFARVYWMCRQWSYDGFDRLYEQLQVKPFEKYYPESQTTPKGLELIQEGLNKNVFEKSDGAVVFKGEDQGLHTRVFLTSAGLPTYEAKDLGLAAAKWEDYKFDQNVIITANDIVEYMKVVLAALNNFYPEVAKRTRHFTHGVIKLAGGAKMSSRKGNVLRALDVLDAADQAHRALVGKQDDQAVLAAVKYAFLKPRIGGDIIYDPAESVAIEGNSGPYLQYAHARARSILAKAPAQDQPVEAFEPDERSLLRKLGQYAEIVDLATAELMPHHICTYLYELAQNFNRFYEKNRVLDDPRQAVRLQLVQLYADTLKNGLELLGITAPDKM